ncbi:MAG: peptide chain release factor 2 [Anaerolineae bacterium]|nr:peptide chain release factor 2 [Anaerolineae bacterium]
MSDLSNRLESLATRVEAIWRRLDLPGKIRELETLEQQAAVPDLWNDPDYAREVMQRIASIQEDVAYWNTFTQNIQDAQELEALEDDDLFPELEAETSRLEQNLARSEFLLMLSGRYDRGNAILAIHSGAGGTDAQDWAEMLLRMFLRWAERRKFKTEILDSLDGDAAGIKSVTVGVSGDFAYGYLKSERGVHRLVRLSPFDAAHRRHTSFVLVEVWPDIGNEIRVEINPDDLEIDVYRASSAGGQHVQKNSTAIRMRHLPSGIVVSCQNERSQAQNRETALRILKARLIQLEEEKQRQQLDILKGEHIDAGWGNQIRSYVLHPYQMVKDHRTDFETGNVQAILDGDLDEFIEAYLRSTVGKGH